MSIYFSFFPDYIEFAKIDHTLDEPYLYPVKVWKKSKRTNRMAKRSIYLNYDNIAEYMLDLDKNDV